MCFSVPFSAPSSSLLVLRGVGRDTLFVLGDLSFVLQFVWMCLRGMRCTRLVWAVSSDCITRHFQFSRQILINAKEGFSQVPRRVSLFRFMVQRTGKITTRVIKLLQGMSTTPTKALSNRSVAASIFISFSMICLCFPQIHEGEKSLCRVIRNYHLHILFFLYSLSFRPQ